MKLLSSLCAIAFLLSFCTATATAHRPISDFQPHIAKAIKNLYAKVKRHFEMPIYSTEEFRSVLVALDEEIGTIATLQGVTFSQHSHHHYVALYCAIYNGILAAFQRRYSPDKIIATALLSNSPIPEGIESDEDKESEDEDDAAEGRADLLLLKIRLFYTYMNPSVLASNIEHLYEIHPKITGPHASA